MKLLSLPDNALFLQNWYERMRMPMVVGAAIVSFLVVFLIIFNAKIQYPDGKMTQTSVYNEYTRSYEYKTVPQASWKQISFWALACAQGVLLLILGTVAAARMAARERTSGTLEFHRSSPTSQLDQIIGLLLGAPSLEWCVFGGTLLVSLFLTVISKITLLAFFKFYFGLILLAFLYHSFAILLALWSYKGSRTNNATGIGIVFVIFVLFYILVGIADSNQSSFYYLTWLPQYEELYPMAVEESVTHRSYHYTHNTHAMRHMFFGFKINTVLFQLMVQLPLIGLIWTGIARKISFPERPLFSKGQSILCILFLLFLFTGSAFTSIIYGNQYYGYGRDTIGFFVYFTYFLVFVSAIGVVPTNPKYIKGLRRQKKLGFNKSDPNSDFGTSTVWLMACCLVVATLYSITIFTYPASIGNKVLVLAVIISYMIYFTKALEYFRLSKHYKKKILFWVGLAVLWGFIPIFGIIIESVARSDWAEYLCFAASPFFGTLTIFDVLSNQSYGVFWSHHTHSFFYFNITLIVNVLLAVITSLLASRERQKIDSTLAA